MVKVGCTRRCQRHVVYERMAGQLMCTVCADEGVWQTSRVAVLVQVGLQIAKAAACSEPGCEDTLQASATAATLACVNHIAPLRAQADVDVSKIAPWVIHLCQAAVVLKRHNAVAALASRPHLQHAEGGR